MEDRCTVPLKRARAARRNARRAGSGGLRRQRALREKLRELQTLVPGGEELKVYQLFMRTADYIFLLRLQLQLLHTLSDLYS